MGRGGMMRAVAREIPAEIDAAADRRGALLLRLAAEPGTLAAERATLPPTLEARLDVLLKEVDGIVLPRSLQVTSGHQDVARLIVSHRRLVGIKMPGRSPVPPDRPDLPDALAARLIEIAKWRGPLSLSVSRRAAPSDHAQVACSVASLRSAVDLALTEGAYDRLLRHVETQAFALLAWTANGAQMQFTGAPALRTTLQEIAGSYLDMARKSRAEAKTGPVRTEGLMIPVEGDLAIVVAGFDKRGLVSVLSRKTALDLIAGWQSRS